MVTHKNFTSRTELDKWLSDKVSRDKFFYRKVFGITEGANECFTVFYEW